MDKATGRVTDEIEYMPAAVEDAYTVGPANAPVEAHGCFDTARIPCRPRNAKLAQKYKHAMGKQERAVQPACHQDGTPTLRYPE